jgi:predicted SAM-dependent methyltransferase
MTTGGPVLRPLRRLAHAVAWRWLSRQPEGVRTTARMLWDEVRIARRVARAPAAFAALEGRTELKVHLGCGPELKPGWVNVDLDIPDDVPPMLPGRAADSWYISYDLRSGTLPLADGSCALIYSSHFFEHLEPAQGYRLMRDCHRALRPGGVFRVCLPDLRRVFDAYLRGDEHYLHLLNVREALPYLVPGTETIVDYVNYGVYQNGEHKCVYDEEKVLRLLHTIGFAEAAPSTYVEGLDSGSDVRRRYSFYVDATK